MKKEFITVHNKETAIRVLNTRVDAVRVKDIMKKGVRVYKDGKIGISGAIGNVSDEILVEKAIENLDTGIEYSFDIEANSKDHRDYSKTVMTPEDVLNITESVLSTLQHEYPDFDFSEKASVSETMVTMKNTEGLDLSYRDSRFELGFIMKEKSSANLFDGFIQYVGRSFDLDEFWAFNRPYLNAYRVKAEIPKNKKVPVVVVGFDTFYHFLNMNLNGERYATGGSVFSGKLGEKLFNEKVVITQCFDSKGTYQQFFDSEGIRLPEDNFTLIENGILKSVFTDKYTSKTYNLQHTGAASGSYDGIPRLLGTPLSMKVDSENIKETLAGQEAIFILVSSGGDFTPDGNYAAPVQLSFLFDGENFVGKLPELNVRSNIYNMLGEDYIGTFECPFYIGEGARLHVFNMEIAE